MRATNMRICAGMAAITCLVALSGCVTAPSRSNPETAPSADIGAATGINPAALVGAGKMLDSDNVSLFGIFYLPAKTSPAQIAAAPALLCTSRGQRLLSSADKPLEHPSEMPGARKLMVRCN